MSKKNEITCPNCGTPIQIDDATYDSIVKQVRDRQFQEELNGRLQAMQTQKDAEIKAAEANAREQMRTEIAHKDQEILTMQRREQHIINEAMKTMKAKDETIKELQLKGAEKEAGLQAIIDRNQLELKRAVEKAVAEERQKSSEKDARIAGLLQEIKTGEAKAESERQKQNNRHAQEVTELKGNIISLKGKLDAVERDLGSRYEAQLKAKDEEIAFYKDFRAKQSVKLLGESLEEHCLNEYDSYRALLPNATFEKDNKVSLESGSKGDFIFRESTDKGIEVTSVMFEMKTEADQTTHKRKNEDFLKELDKDRKEKGCEYAVLVSTLEPESERYNKGIVSMYPKYEKMYVVRPQCFIPILMIIRSAALNTVAYREELMRLKNQSIDVSTFEADLEDYKDAVAKCLEQAGKKRESAVERIDKVIASLQLVRDDIVKFGYHEEQAAKKAEKLTIKKIAKIAPSVAKMIADQSTPEKELAGSVIEGKVVDGKFVEDKAG